jgi:hypothetical protein
MSDNVIGIIGGTIGIGQYIINDYVITIAESEGEYGYTMTVARGDDVQTISLYGLTPEQYNSMIGYLEQAQAAAQSAAGSASDAADYMEAAINAANTANTQAGRATQASNTAQSYASQAQTAKQSAETAKNDAQTARTQAQGYRQAAEAAATRAETAATNAGNAQTAAEAAQTSAEAAQTAAETAETNAQTYAGHASTRATDAAQSAASAVQTLAQVQAEGQVQIAAIDAEGQRVLDSIPEDYSQMTEDVADLKSQMSAVDSMALGAYPTDTVSGSLASFNDGADSLPVKDLTIGIESVQSGSGGPSPTNIRPISGWTGANINANGTTIPITFPTEAGTVYGGVLDVTTGVLTVDRAMVTYVGAQSESWTKDVSGSTIRYRITISDMKSTSAVMANIAKNVGRDLDTIFTSSKYLYYISAIETAADFKTWLASNNLTVVYELATPTTYQLTPVEVLTLLGSNTIYADTGDTTVTYRADPTLYADKRTNATRSIIAGIEPTMTASKAYTVGQLLIVGDTLYKVAASIASGATLTPGTNVNATTVAEQLILLANA